MVSPLTQTLNYFYTKQGEPSKDWSPFIIMKFLSYNQNATDITDTLNKIVFHTQDKRFIEALIYGGLHKQRTPFIKYIKKTKEKVQEYKPIISMIQNKFKWTDKELEYNLSIISEQLEDKNTLNELALMTGDEKLIKKLKLIKKTKEVIKKKPIITLNKWM